jgi:hypothetical protein
VKLPLCITAPDLRPQPVGADIKAGPRLRRRGSALVSNVSVNRPRDYTIMDGDTVHAKDIHLVARFYVESVMHTAAHGTGSSCLGAAASVPGTVPSSILAAGNLKAGKGGTVTFGHPSGTFSLTAEQVLAASPNDISFAKVAYPRTARIICNGTVYIKNERPTGAPAWKEADEITPESFYLEADAVSITR